MMQDKVSIALQDCDKYSGCHTKFMNTFELLALFPLHTEIVAQINIANVRVVQE